MKMAILPRLSDLEQDSNRFLFLLAHHTHTRAQEQITEAQAHAGGIRLGTLCSMCVFAAQDPLYEGVSVTAMTGVKC